MSAVKTHRLTAAQIAGLQAVWRKAVLHDSQIAGQFLQLHANHILLSDKQIALADKIIAELQHKDQKWAEIRERQRAAIPLWRQQLCASKAGRTRRKKSIASSASPSAEKGRNSDGPASSPDANGASLKTARRS